MHQQLKCLSSVSEFLPSSSGAWRPRKSCKAALAFKESSHSISDSRACPRRWKTATDLSALDSRDHHLAGGRKTSNPQPLFGVSPLTILTMLSPPLGSFTFRAL